MEATAADTPAALASRIRASSSWLTNSLRLEASGRHQGRRRAGVDAGQLSLGRCGDGRQLPQRRPPGRGRRCGAGRARRGPGSRRWPPRSDTVPAAALRARTDRNCRPITGTKVMGANRGDDRSAWALANSARAASSRCTDPADVSSPGVSSLFTCSRLASPCLVVVVGRPRLHGQEPGPDHEHHHDGGDDQPRAPPPTDSLAHGNHSLTPGVGPRGRRSAGPHSSTRRTSVSRIDGTGSGRPSLVNDALRTSLRRGCRPGRWGRPGRRCRASTHRATSIPACRSRLSG